MINKTRLIAAVVAIGVVGGVYLLYSQRGQTSLKPVSSQQLTTSEDQRVQQASPSVSKSANPSSNTEPPARSGPPSKRF